MTTIEIWEDAGPIVSGHGTTRQQVTNCNWRSGSSLDITYHLLPLRRPEDSTGWKQSFTKYLYFKLSGTFTKAKNFKVALSAVPDNNTQLYGKMGSTYNQPSDEMDGSLMYIPGTTSWYPLIGTDPSTASLYDATITAGTWYTSYLVTQLRVINSIATDVGNTSPATIKFTFSEY